MLNILFVKMREPYKNHDIDVFGPMLTQPTNSGCTKQKNNEVTYGQIYLSVFTSIT
jgi:hypothetical protein